MHVVIFEGSRWKTFAPVALGRPVFMLASGMSTLLAKQIRHLNPSRLSLWVRPELAEACRQRIVPKLNIPTTVNQPLDDEPALLINGRSLHLKKFTPPNEPAVSLDDGDDVISWARAQQPGLSPEDVFQRTAAWMSLRELPIGQSQSRITDTLADLIHWNEASIVADSTAISAYTPLPPGPWHVINPENVKLCKEVKLSPGCVLDGSKGPVVIDEHASIGPNSVIQGPCYIGPYCEIRPLTLIQPGTSLGTLCRVGGDVKNSIIFGYSNKAHEGYLGDSYVGKWVNLGAGTTVSNLKNTLGEVTARVGHRNIPTGRRKLGAMIGDHVKTAIGTRMMAGSYLGFCCQLASSRILPAFVPSLTFLTDHDHEPYRIPKAIEVITRAFGQKNRQWTDMDEQILRYVAEVAAPQVEGAEA
jgi:UDP-N-acetylglucosamine diphosphorylase/glucosamine-1-phosphate N-acetyltransferase